MLAIKAQIHNFAAHAATLGAGVDVHTVDNGSPPALELMLNALKAGQPRTKRHVPEQRRWRVLLDGQGLDHPRPALGRAREPQRQRLELADQRHLHLEVVRLAWAETAAASDTLRSALRRLVQLGARRAQRADQPASIKWSIERSIVYSAESSNRSFYLWLLNGLSTVLAKGRSGVLSNVPSNGLPQLHPDNLAHAG